MLKLDTITKRFDGDVVAVSNLSLEVERGEFLTLLGPSGCGKTTTLRMIAGFETPTAGRILVGERDVTQLSPQRRGFGMVFQNYALFPHLDVAENVAFGLKTRGVARDEIRRRVEDALALVDLAGYGKRRVQELSGGQQQRVALARALAPEPEVLLLDEPLSNLDAALRERTRTELRALLKRVGITAIFVTHDQEEAFALSDRIAVMEKGRLQQLGTPEELYARPTNAFVASFLGRANFLDARVVERDGDDLVCEVADGVRWRVSVANGGGADTGAGADAMIAGEVDASAVHHDGRYGDAVPESGGRVRVMVRPEALRVVPTPEAGDLVGEVAERRFAGPVTHYIVRVGDASLLVHGGPTDAAVGERVGVRAAGGMLALAGGDA